LLIIDLGVVWIHSLELCVVGANLYVYSMHKSSGSRLKCLCMWFNVWITCVIIYNENGSVMYEMIDECTSCGILVNIEDLNFMILHFKVSNLSFPLICYLFCF